MNKTLLTKVAFVLASVAAVAAFQRHVMAVPVVGSYLPR